MPKKRGKGSKTTKLPDDNAPLSSSASTGELADDNVEFDPDKLSVAVEGQWKSFKEWTLDYAHRYYPHAGRLTYRVPPVDFNTQALADDFRLGFSQLAKPKEEDRKKDRSQADVAAVLEKLGRRLEKNGAEDSSEAGRGLFIVSNAQYENYLRDLKDQPTKGAVPPLANQVARRGELDLLVLHSQYGIVLIQVKGVGLQDSWQPTEEQLQAAIRKKVKDAQEQLKKDVVVLRHVMKDLDLQCHVHTVVALPFVTSQLLQVSMDKAQTEKAGQDGLVYLCSEHMTDTDTMLAWWTRYIAATHQDSRPLTDFQLQSIVGRYCGLLSVVSVWCKSSLRVEVRDVAEAADEVGNRFANIVLTAEQRNALDNPDKLVFLHGPPGTGKSVMMVIKARQWLLQGHDVIVLNVDFGREGNPVGHYIHDSITQWLSVNDDSTVSKSENAAKSKPKTSHASGGKRSKQSKKSSYESSGNKDSDKEVTVGPSEQCANNSHGPQASAITSESTPTSMSATERRDTGADSAVSEPDTTKKIPSACSTALTGDQTSSKTKEEGTFSVTADSEMAQPSVLERKASDLDANSSEADTTSEKTSGYSTSISSSSDTENTGYRNIGHVSRIDFDLGMNSEEVEAQQKIEELMKQIQGTLRPGVRCHFVFDEYYWKDRLLPLMENIRGQFPDSNVWCAEVSGTNIPKDFTRIKLTTVLRCPPTVQTLLKEVDWNTGHKYLYTGDSTLQGLPTDGFKPVFFEHKNHQALSPLDCIQCAELLLAFFREELKLSFGSYSGKCDPHAVSLQTEENSSKDVSSTSANAADSSMENRSRSSSDLQHGDLNGKLPIPKSKKKKRTHGLFRRVKFSDIVVVFSYPRKCLNRSGNLLLIEDMPQDIHHDNIENSVFLGCMKAAGLPVVFRAPNSDAREIALPPEDKVLFSVTSAVTGLERKVVVYIPCESTTYEYPVTPKYYSQAQMEVPPETSQHTEALSSQPTCQATSSLSTEDWVKIRERLLEQNEKGLFYAASRCLSIFVFIIP